MAHNGGMDMGYLIVEGGVVFEFRPVDVMLHKNHLWSALPGGMSGFAAQVARLEWDIRVAFYLPDPQQWHLIQAGGKVMVVLVGDKTIITEEPFLVAEKNTSAPAPNSLLVELVLKGDGVTIRDRDVWGWGDVFAEVHGP